MSQPITITPMQRFWRLLQPDKREVTNVYIYAIFNGLVNLSLPLGIQAIVNLIQGGQVSTSWIVLVVIVILGVAITGVLQIFQLRITENLQQKIFARAAFEFAYRMPRIKLERLYRQYAPELMNRFFDIVSVQKGLSKLLIDFSTATLQVIFGLLLLSLYHPFFIAFSLILVLFVAAIFRFTGRRGLETSLQESMHKYAVVHWLEELARTTVTFKLAGQTQLPLLRTDKNVGRYLSARESHFKILVQQFSLMVVFKVIVATGLLAIGGILVMEQQMNIGQFVAAEIIILLVMTSVEKLILSLETVYDVLTALEKVGQVTDMELEQHEGVNLSEACTECGLEVEVNNVSFAYPDQNTSSLKKVNLHLKPNENVALAGLSGSGRNTLLHLIAGLYELHSGSIAFNSIPVGNLRLTSLRDVIGDSLVHEHLFDGTIAENITMGRPAATFENMRWAVKAMGLESYISKLPKGYDTAVQPEGKTLPGDIVQRILLARSIAIKPKLLLVVDAFDALGHQERQRIMNFLTQPDQPWTMLVLTNDAAWAASSDRVVIMEAGTVAATGTFEALKNNPLFTAKHDA